MPVLTAGPPAITNLAQELVNDLAAGRVARQSYGSKAVAFEWAAGLPMILARQVQSAIVAGLSFTATRVKPSGTPAGEVPEGGTKNTAVVIESDQVTLTKYAGLGTFTLEQALTTEALGPALASVIVSSCLMAYDADCGAVLAADHGITQPAAPDWPSAILGGIAAVAGGGGAPAILVVSAADYPAVVASPGVGYAMNPTDGVPSMYGLRIVLMAGLAAGTGFVLDPAAVLAVENEASPAALVDPFSQAHVNTTRVVVDALLGFVVTAPGGVCQVSTGGVTTTGGGGSSKSKASYALGA